MFGKKTENKHQEPQSLDEMSFLDWETNHIELDQRSERRAWIVAKAFGGCFFLSVIAIGLLMPLKENVPYVIRVNETTGAIDLVTSVRGKDIEFDEAQDKYWVNQYVINRESYDWHTLANRYVITQELSSTEVFKPFKTMYEGSQSPDKTLGDKYEVKVHVTSITVTAGDTATVRFARSKIAKNSGSEMERTNWVATVGYQYSPEILTTENQRLINPFGFEVQSYQVVPEINNLQATPTTE